MRRESRGRTRGRTNASTHPFCSTCHKMGLAPAVRGRGGIIRSWFRENEYRNPNRRGGRAVSHAADHGSITCTSKSRDRVGQRLRHISSPGRAVEGRCRRERGRSSVEASPATHRSRVPQRPAHGHALALGDSPTTISTLTSPHTTVRTVPSVVRSPVIRSYASTNESRCPDHLRGKDGAEGCVPTR